MVAKLFTTVSLGVLVSGCVAKKSWEQSHQSQGMPPFARDAALVNGRGMWVAFYPRLPTAGEHCDDRNNCITWIGERSDIEVMPLYEKPITQAMAEAAVYQVCPDAVIRQDGVHVLPEGMVRFERAECPAVTAEFKNRKAR